MYAHTVGVSAPSLLKESLIYIITVDTSLVSKIEELSLDNPAWTQKPDRSKNF